MRENRTYGSEGGVAIAIPTPIKELATLARVHCIDLGLPSSRMCYPILNHAQNLGLIIPIARNNLAVCACTIAMY